MSGQVCIITGSNSGLGFSAATKMAHLGYEVVMACRNETSANKAIINIKAKVTDAKLIFMKLDLASTKSIKNFVKKFLESNKDLNILINNAAVCPEHSSKSPVFTTDGFENAFGTNHLGHFYLTLLLMEKLKSCSPSRIVVVASSLHDPETMKNTRKQSPHLDFDNLQLFDSGTFDAFLAYSNSKLANILFVKEMNRRLGENSGVTINALCPGWIPATNLGNLSSCYKCCLLSCFHYLCRCCKITRTVDEGSDCILFVALDKSLDDVSGKYFFDCKEKASSLESNDVAVAEKLWNASIGLLEISQDSPLKAFV